MRIQRLSFDFFGQFTDKTFDFGQVSGPTDFHVIYGPNEAGKTTTMEGYLRLLYGFPLREPYGFKHQRANLRVSGVLEIGGKAYNFTRLPTRSGSLRDDAGAVLPETAIASHLGGLSLEDYRSLLCLDDATIEKGGDDIANARGDIGRLLFSAAAGVADLNTVLEHAQDEANSFYKKNGSKNQVAGLKRELADIERQIREADVNASAWRKLKEALQASENDEAKAKKNCNTLRVELAKVSTMRRALPMLGAIDRLQSEIAGYEGYPDKIDLNTEDLLELKTEQATAQAEVSRLTEEINEAERKRNALVLDDERLRLRERLDDLDELRSRMQTATIDLPRRRKACDEALADLASVARELGAAKNVNTTIMVKTPAEIANLEGLRDELNGAIKDKEAEEREVKRLLEQLAVAQEEHQSLLDSSPAYTGVINILSRFDADILAPAVAMSNQAIASAKENLQDALDALTVDGRTFDAVPDCQIDQSKADELTEHFGQLTDKILRTDETISHLQEEVAVKSAQIARLENNIGVVSDEYARQARERRDALWRDHRGNLTDATADAFEPSMRQVDDLASARLAHARELGELRQLEQALVEAETRLTNNRTKLDGFRSQTEAIKRNLHQVAATLGLPQLSPARFRDWIERREIAERAKRNQEKITKLHSETLHQAKQLYDALLPLVPLEAPSFESSLAAARRLAKEERDQKESVHTALQRKTSLDLELGSRRRKLSDLEYAAEKAAERWSAAVQNLFEGSISQNVLMRSIGQLQQIREHEAKRQQAVRQISAMESDQRQFIEAIEILKQQFDIDENAPIQAFRILEGIANQAQNDKVQCEALSKKIAQDLEKRKAIQTQLQNIDLLVEQFGALFPISADTNTLDALRNTVGKAVDIIQKRMLIADYERQLFEELSVNTLAEARDELSESTAASLEARAASLEAELVPAETYLSNATVTRANAERDLSSVSASTEIADLVEQRMTLQIQIEDALLNYMEREFGLRLAEEAIRRYRDNHRSGMMAATEQAFAELTNGTYEKLLTKPDGASEVLVAVSTNGTPKQISDMSKGTRFQLYLALRAAAYEQMIAQGMRLPFFCDDVFETFDENRTRAACRLMDRIGHKGQAIYLTHHRHVVEIAKEVCVAQPIIHEI